MRRKNALITMATLVGGLAASSSVLAAASSSSGNQSVATIPNLGKQVRPPAHGPVQVGFVIGPELVSIDVFGPMAAFGNAMIAPMVMEPALFNIYAIAETTQPINVGGLKLQPQYTFGNAPQPNVLVVPEQKSLPATIAYIKKASLRADITMSVCTGAFLTAKAGLFDGLKATTHHAAYDDFAQQFPQVTLVRGPRYVENADVSSSGGESSGIDLALRVVERYYGKDIAAYSAYNMEYRRSTRPLSVNDV